MKKSRSKKTESHPTDMPILEAWLQADTPTLEQCDAIRLELQNCLPASQQAGMGQAESLAELFISLTDLAVCLDTDADCDDRDVSEILEFIHGRASILFDCLAGDSSTDAVAQTISEAGELWGEHLSLVYESQLAINELDSADDDSGEEDFSAPSTQQIDAMLAAIGNVTSGEESPIPEQPETQPKPQNKKKSERSSESEFESSGDSLPDPPSGLGLSSDVLEDAELKEAYLDDANRCLAAMEQVVLTAEESADPESCVREFCRQLHTLKGASASVGLSDLANYLHEVEEWMSKNDSSIEIELLLAAVDSVRTQIGMIENPGVVAEPQEPAPRSKSGAKSKKKANQAPAKKSTSQSSFNPSAPAASTEASVRVRASQLDKLMDMLAELIVLRNQRDSQVGQLNALNDELLRCSHRLGQFREEQMDMMRTHFATAENGFHSKTQPGGGSYLGTEPTTANAVSEITSDLTEISRGIKNIYKPIAKENQALSLFIRHFRQELIQLRRVPLIGLFQKLQRSARDAAKVEDRKIQVKLVGKNVGLEQTLQEQLYDPLLHLVRNAVGHGIEDEQTRQKNGKNPVGTITLEAKSSANLLVISIKDDGKGLDYGALRRRGYERGLLSPDRSPTTRELANLIFHPGFSTRDQASEVAGRGIGMDVVSGAINQLHGRIEIDSHPGSGTTMRISVPLKSGIEHTMVFRSGGQLYALPMQSIASAQKRGSNPNDTDQDASIQRWKISHKNGLEHGQLEPGQQQLLLESSHNERCSQVALVVDEIVGPEEVVVRSLPRSLFDHPFLNGLTLSGEGEVVLFVDGEQIVGQAGTMVASGASDSSSNGPQQGPAVDECDLAAGPRVLVVDDSLSARKALVKRLRRRGFRTEEASDGVEALEQIRRSRFDLLTTDLDMPRLSGLDLLADIHENAAINIPTIVVSNRNQNEVRERAEQLGALAFINKPVTDEILDELLKQVEYGK